MQLKSLTYRSQRLSLRQAESSLSWRRMVPCGTTVVAWVVGMTLSLLLLPSVLSSSPRSTLAARQQLLEYQNDVQFLHTRRLHVPILSNHKWPGFLVPARERHLGIAHSGDWGRLRHALARYRDTGNLTVGIVGGSISSGAGALDTHNWVEWFEDWMHLQYNGSRHGIGDEPPEGSPSVRVTNGAVPGTLSSYMSVCYSKHVPKDVDIVIVEYALNDDMYWNPTPFNNAVRRPFERLLRKLLNYPNKPAIVLLNAYAWGQANTVPGRFDGQYWTGADAEFWELATYYQIPMLSIKACCYGLMKRGVPGFRVDRRRGNTDGMLQDPETDKKLKDEVFYWDRVHPNGATGHRAMADLVIQLFLLVERSLKLRPFTEVEQERVFQRTQPLDPMIPGNWESQDDKCYVGEQLKDLVQAPPKNAPAKPFEWLNDQPPERKAKWGYVATDAGQFIRFKVDTRTASHGSDGDRLSMTAVEIAHLVSYEGMGLANVTCVKNCKCEEHTMDSLHEDRVSLVKLFEVKVSQHQSCVLQVTALGKANSSDPSAGTKVKITGLMISDEGANIESSPMQDLNSFLALDSVTEALSADGQGHFEVRNSGWATAGMEQVREQQERLKESETGKGDAGSETEA